MNEKSDGNGAPRPMIAQSPEPVRVDARPRPATHTGPNGTASFNGDVDGAPRSGVDTWTFVDALLRHWTWLPLGGLLLAGLGYWAGLNIWKSRFTATARLLHATAPHITEVVGDRENAPETFATLLRSPELIQTVAASAQPTISATNLAKNLNIIPEHNSDVIDIVVTANDPRAAVELANRYAWQAVRFTQERQSNNAVEINDFLAQQLTPVERELASLSQQLTNRPPPRVPVAQTFAATPTLLIEKLQSARIELVELQSRYTEEHPLVRDQRAKIAGIEKQLTLAAQTSATNSLGSLHGFEFGASGRDTADTEFLTGKAQALENTRLALLGKKLAALTVQIHAPGSCQLLAEATLQDLVRHGWRKKTALLALFGGVFGVLLTTGLVLLVEALDTRLKTAADVSRVTRLPILATASDLDRMAEPERRDWAFRAWTSIQGQLSPSTNHGLVCGFTSSEHGEGRSTCVRLLADAASQRGFRVLTIVARPSSHPAKTVNGDKPAPASTAAPANGVAVANNLFISPAEVTEKLIGPNREPVVQVPLPGWVWDLERRKQWQAALHDWSKIDNIALLVELPPASVPEAVLLAENLPNLIWLADGRKATAAKTRQQLETLRHARCRLAGAVLNNAPVSFLRTRLARWLP